MTREQETHFLEALWAIMLSFVGLAFGFDPVQQAMDVGKRSVAMAEESGSVVLCGTTFNRRAKNRPARAPQRCGEREGFHEERTPRHGS
jgi:hypothetical protein